MPELREDSATSQIAALSRKEAFIRHAFVPINEATVDRLREERRKLTQWLGPVIARATQRSRRKFRAQTTTAIIDTGVVVSAVVTRAPRKERDESNT